MTEIKYRRDMPFVDRWAKAIGKVILSFGLLEVESHMWLLQMPDEPEVFPKDSFGKRASRIQQLIERFAFDDKWRADAVGAWEKALALAEVRNGLAHSPLLFGGSDLEIDNGEPDWIGVVDVRLLGQGKTQAEAQYSLQDIAQTTDAIAELVEELGGLRNQWCSARDDRLMG